jgi:hypothetical protein
MALDIVLDADGTARAGLDRLEAALTESVTGRRPEAVAPMPAEAVDRFFAGFVFAMSHDAPPDVAFFDAYFRLGPQATGEPLLLAPALGFVEDMESARLNRRLHDLVARIATVRDPFWLGAHVTLDRYALGFAPGATSLGRLRDELVESILRGQIRFDHESDTGEALPRVAAQVEGIVEAAAHRPPRAAQIPKMSDTEREGAGSEAGAPPEIGAAELASPGDEKATPPAAEADRYLDAAFYEGHLARGERPDPARKLADPTPLTADALYTFEIAIRARPTGTDSARPGKPVIPPPREGRETATVYARVRSLDEAALTFDDGFLPFAWPWDSDSEAVPFRCRTKAPPREDYAVRIEIRLYSGDLHLLELVEIRDVIVGESTDPERARFKHWPATRPTQLSPAARDNPVSLALHVMKRADGYSLEAIFGRGGMRLTPIPLGRTVPSADIAALLKGVRDFWTRLVVGKLSARESLTTTGYAAAMARMWAFGGRAWEVLFGQGRGGQAGGAEALGTLIARLDLPRDSLIEVSCEGDAGELRLPLVDPQAARGAEGPGGSRSVLGPRLSRRADEGPRRGGPAPRRRAGTCRRHGRPWLRRRGGP